MHIDRRRVRGARAMSKGVQSSTNQELQRGFTHRKVRLALHVCLTKAKGVDQLPRTTNIVELYLPFTVDINFGWLHIYKGEVEERGRERQSIGK